jgi:hypothetical protein
MALVSRPLAHPAAGYHPRLIHAVALAMLLAAAMAEAVDVALEPYREARRTGALAVVAGRAYAEPRTLTAPARPITGTTVTLLPRSSELRATLERLKEGSRESSKTFAAAAPAMRRAKEAYERELLEAGAPDLALLVQVDGDGGFRIEEVPAGDWMLLGWHGSAVDVSAPSVKAKDKELYRPQSRLLGYQSVTVWLRDLTITRGATVTVELTDRNSWFRGVVEERSPGPGR